MKTCFQYTSSELWDQATKEKDVFAKTRKTPSGKKRLLSNPVYSESVLGKDFLPQIIKLRVFRMLFSVFVKVVIFSLFSIRQLLEYAITAKILKKRSYTENTWAIISFREY